MFKSRVGLCRFLWYQKEALARMATPKALWSNQALAQRAQLTGVWKVQYCFNSLQKVCPLWAVLASKAHQKDALISQTFAHIVMLCAFQKKKDQDSWRTCVSLSCLRFCKSVTAQGSKSPQSSLHFGRSLAAKALQLGDASNASCVISTSKLSILDTKCCRACCCIISTCTSSETWVRK